MLAENLPSSKVLGETVGLTQCVARELEITSILFFGSISVISPEPYRLPSYCIPLEMQSSTLENFSGFV